MLEMHLKNRKEATQSYNFSTTAEHDIFFNISRPTREKPIPSMQIKYLRRTVKKKLTSVSCNRCNSITPLTENRSQNVKFSGQL